LKRDVRLMVADITHGLPEAEALQQQLGSQSIPFSVVFRAGDPQHPVILRDVYTADSLLAALDAPGNSLAARP
jgi:thiol:disulfide interchange protein